MHTNPEKKHRNPDFERRADSCSCAQKLPEGDDRPGGNKPYRMDRGEDCTGAYAGRESTALLDGRAKDSDDFWEGVPCSPRRDRSLGTRARFSSAGFPDGKKERNRRVIPKDPRPYSRGDVGAVCSAGRGIPGIGHRRRGATTMGFVHFERQHPVFLAAYACTDRRGRICCRARALPSSPPKPFQEFLEGGRTSLARLSAKERAS